MTILIVSTSAVNRSVSVEQTLNIFEYFPSNKQVEGEGSGFGLKCSTYPHISSWGTHHGGCIWRHKLRRGKAGCEGCKCVLVRVLVRVLVLVKFRPQQWHRAKGGTGPV